MAFWGVEVKPGKPYTHSFDRGRGRLHISQATLGLGSSSMKSLVQCNVGKKSPVFLCALLPDKTESCHLDVEFEEEDGVVFSIIGPRSVHLTGYFQGSGRHSNLNDDTDSYGEDIGNSETDASNHSSDEDDYDDSFIDDDNPDDFPSPVSNDEVVGDETLDTKKPTERKGSHKRRLKKKYQSIESDDHKSPKSPRKNIISCFSGLESEDDDKFPISSLHKSRTAENGRPVGRREDEGFITNRKNQADVVVDGDSESSLLHSDVKGHEDGFELKKERRERPSVRKSLEADILNSNDALKDKLQHTEQDTQRVGQDLLTNSQDQKPATDKGLDLPNHSLLPSNELGIENCTKSKKKRKERTKEGKTLESGDLEDKLQHTEQDTQRVGQDLLTNSQDQKPATDKGLDLPNHSLLPSNELGIENCTKSKKKRKERTKEGKTLESGDLEDCKARQDKAADQKPATDNEPGSENGLKRKKRRKEFAAEGVSVEGSAVSVEGSANDNVVLKEDTTKQNEDKSGDDHPTSEQDQKFSDIKSVDIDSHQVADGDQPGDKKSKKKKKKSKNQEYEDINEPLLTLEGENRSSKVFEDKNVEAKPSQARTLSNGLVIEELGRGKPDGKVAALGKKVTVHYVGKLKENGQTFDSNIGSSPFKFCLGAEDIIDGWNIGLDGMRVGDKRRLTIPPSMGYGNHGDAGENIPPNSWLVYEIELIGVR